MDQHDLPRRLPSLLAMAAWQRLLCASALLAVLWLLVAWALGGDA